MICGFADGCVGKTDLHDGMVGASKISRGAVDGPRSPDSLTAANPAAASVGTSERGSMGVRTNSLPV